LLELLHKYILLVGNCNWRCRVVSKSKGNQLQVMGYYSPEAVKRLKALSKATRIPQAAYLREALDDLLKKYGATLRKAAKGG
jgi:hypothetical protein